MLRQVSVFSENQKGSLVAMTSILFENNINILGSVTNESSEYGVIRMIVSDTEKAVKALSEKGYLCRSKPIIGVELVDKPGSLNTLLLELEESNVNVDYIYLCFDRDKSTPIIILHTDDIYEVENHLKAKGFEVR